MQEKFLTLINDLTDNKFYVPTNGHSSGFNECELMKIDDEDLEIKPDIPIFLVNEEGSERELTFKELKLWYPKFTLSKRYAFEGKFETWDRFKKALDGEISIDLVEI